MSDTPETVEDPVEAAPKKPRAFRIGKFPKWDFSGWQLILFFGSLPDPNAPQMLILGWKTFLFGIFKKSRDLTEGQPVSSDDIKGFIIQGQVWLPVDRIGKL